MRPNLLAVVAYVSRETGVPEQDIVGFSRRYREQRARALAYYVAHHRYGCTFAELGREFGRSDHTGPLCAVRNLEALCVVDPERLGRVRALMDGAPVLPGEDLVA